MLAGLIGLAGFGTAAGQVVRGQVMDTTSGAAVGNGFVVLVGADGKEIIRTLSDATGHFTVRAPAAGRYRLRSERIGFRVAISPPIQIDAGQVVDYQLKVAAFPIRLDELRVVSGDSPCKVRPEDGLATATVWEEAKKALAAVAWTQRQQQLLRVTIRSFERQLDLGFTIKSESTVVKSGYTNRPFHARTPEDLATQGYIQLTPDTTYLFFAPDAAVLFSDPFLNTHCLRVEPGGTAHPGRIGLAFEPARKRSVPDIKGTMWLEEKSAELETVEFHYVNGNLPGSTERAGGRVDFQRLNGGAWVVNYFSIRMPQFGYVEQNDVSDLNVSMGNRRTVGTSGGHETRVEVVAFREEGGEVLDVFDRDGNRLAGASAATLSGMVFDSTLMRPLIDATIRLAGTGHTTRSGPGGTFRMDRLPEGTYELEFFHGDMPAWGVLRSAARVSLQRGQVTQTLLAVPPTARLIRELCPDMPTDSGFAVVGGRVTESGTGTGIPDARVQFVWKGFEIQGGNSKADKLAVNTASAGFETTSDSTGQFRVCGLPPSTQIMAQVALGKNSLPPVEFRLERGELKEVNLMVPRVSK